MTHLPLILAFGFAAPWLMAGGAAATSIPIVIHLLNKRKFRILFWAAMDFLLAAQRRNARRLRFQRWLLLALRCLALLILAAAIAQVFWENNPFRAIAEDRAIVILWDDSYSMGYQQGDAAGGKDNTAFEHSRHIVSDYISTLHNSDRVALIRTSRVAAANPIGKTTYDHAAIKAQVDSAILSDCSTSLPDAFDQAAQLLKDLPPSVSSRQVLLVTDFSNSSIRDPDHGTMGPEAATISHSLGLSGDHLKTSVAAVQKLATVSAIDVGVDSQTNHAITNIRPFRPTVVAHYPADFEITVFNGDDKPALNIPMTLSADGVIVQTIKIPKIEGGSAVTTRIRNIEFATPGRHLLEARLGASDFLPIDDIRRLIVNVRREIAVLLVDGRLAPDPSSIDSTALIWAAYGPPVNGKPSSMFAPTTITAGDLAKTTLANYDVIILSDTTPANKNMSDALKEFVTNGGLLIYFPGPNTNVDSLENSIGHGAAGNKLLPAVVGIAQKNDNGFTFALQNYIHPALEEFRANSHDNPSIGLDRVQTKEYLQLTTSDDESPDVILRYNGPNGAPGEPAIVKKDVGNGSVVLFASTADLLWNDLMGHPNSIPLIHEITHYSLRRNTLNTGSGLTLRVGDSIELPPDFAAPGSWSGPNQSTIDVATATDSAGRSILKSPPLPAAGIYTPSTPGARPVIVVNPDPEEADIRHVSPAAMSAKLGIDLKNIITQTGSTSLAALQAGSSSSQSALGAMLLIVALFLFCMESLLAMLFSTYR